MGRILIVDDRPLNREYLVAVLRSEGHVLLEAADGREALDIAEHVKPQLVISDIMMPEMDGPELVRRLRAHPDLKDVPVVFCTATYLEEEARALAANCGVAHVLLKPTPARLVLALVRKYLDAPGEVAASEELPSPKEAAFDKPTTEQQIVSQVAELLELSDRVSRETDPQLLLQKLCRGARYILGASYVAALILDERSPAFASSGLGPCGRWGEAGLLAESALCRRLLASRHALRSSNAAEMAETLGLPIEAVEGQTLIGAPVASSGRLVGLLCFAGKLGGAVFSEHDERLVETLATQLAVSYETATLRDKLVAAESKYRSLVESVPAIIFIAEVGPAWRTIYVSPQVERTLGFPASAWVDDPDLWNRQVHPQDKSRMKAAAAQSIATSEPYSEEYRIRTRDGRTVWFREDLAVVRREPGGATLVQGIRIDVTERKAAAARQAMQHAVTAILAEAVPFSEAFPRMLATLCRGLDWEMGAVWLLDDASQTLACAEIWSEEDERLAEFGRACGKLSFPRGVGLPGQVWSSQAPQYLRELSADINSPRRQHAMAAGLCCAFAFPISSPSRFLGVFEFFTRTRRSPETELASILTTIGSQIGQVLDRRRAEQALRATEEQLRQSQKLDAIGRLAGGIAHDFNNLLTVIIGTAQISLEDLPADSPGRRDFDLIEKTGQRASTLTRQLLAFSRKQVLQPRVLDLNGVVAEMEKMLRRLIGENIVLKTTLRRDLGRTKADPGQLEQVLVNLAVNARDAMPNGGCLEISTDNAQLGPDFTARYPGVPPGQYVRLTVGDTGGGIEPSNMPRIFEPFFTTKEKGKGTGLGLATVFGIASQSGGCVTVSSQVGRGTEFHVYLPRVEAALAEPRTELGAPRVLDRPATVLLVEDEPDVRRMARGSLERAGCVVVEADSGSEALAVAARTTGSIDLLITDVVMPGMSGRELWEKLWPKRPDMRILFMSGYTDDALFQHHVLDPDTPFLPKPFTPHDLTEKVLQVLQGRAAG